MKDLLSLAPRRTLVALAVAAGVGAALHFGLLAPLAKHTAGLNTHARTLAADVAQVSLASRELTEWLRQNPRTAGMGRGAADVMTPELAVPALLQKLSDLGARHEVQVLSIHPEAPDVPITVDTGDGAPRTYVRIPIRVTTRAQYRLLGEFLDDLQRQGGLALVSKVHLSAGARPGQVTAELWIDAFGRIS
jgi:hypothetical protein